MCTMLRSCGQPNNIISFFSPLLKKFADPCTSKADRMNRCRELDAQKNRRVSDVKCK